MIQRALLSVSDKTGIVEFARALSARGVELLSTGGTAKLLTQQGVAVTEVSDYTGFPEMMEGRVKTLHPKIHGGILGRRGQDEATMDAYGIGPIDLVAVNLYPFVQTIKRPDCNLEMAIENIDIGGPTMLRSAAKNYVSVTVVVSPDDYTRILENLSQHQGRVADTLRFELAVKAFEHTARYDGAIANYLGAINPEGPSARFPSTFNFQVTKSLDLRYGENPHQAAAFYVDEHQFESSISTTHQIQGKALSFNNIADTDAAIECVKCFSEPACVIVKHANPCGVAVAESLLTAYDHAYATDATSAFGGIIAFNRPLDKNTAIAIIERQFVEVIIAPTIDEDAKTILARKANVRVMACGAFGTAVPGWDFKKVTGGLLVQDRDLAMVSEKHLRTVTQRAPTAAELRDLLFVWKVAKFVKSNAIVYGKNNVTIGIGAGQMSRVYSAKIATIKAAGSGLQVAGSVMASDAFFPFRDGIDAAAEVGITAVIQPGGSMRDQEIINAANEHGMAMVFTDVRHFRH